MNILLQAVSVVPEILIFLVVIIVLVLVHELGHLIVAKVSGMRVDEFGFGFPPRALTLGKMGETEITLNWIPLGGFVRIYGEDGVTGEGVTDTARAFSSRPRILQALVLLAGVAMNVLLAYVLIVGSLVVGNQQELEYGHEGTATHIHMAFAQVRPGSPADKAGLKSGDIVTNSVIREGALGIGYNGTNPVGLMTLIGTDANLSPMIFSVERNSKPLTITVVPEKNIIAGSPNQPAIGVSIVEIGIVKTPLLQSFTDGFTVLGNMTTSIAGGLYDLLKGIVTFKADLSQVAGPVGIVGIVGQATATGFGELLSLTALVSINLAIINLIPIPALDGGRLLFVIIEAIIRRPLNAKIAERVNMVGFGLLLLLMFVVTAHDIFRLFQ